MLFTVQAVNHVLWQAERRIGNRRDYISVVVYTTGVSNHYTGMYRWARGTYVQ